MVDSANMESAPSSTATLPTVFPVLLPVPFLDVALASSSHIGANEINAAPGIVCVAGSENGARRSLVL